MSSEERFGYEWSRWKNIDRNYKGQFLRWIFPLGENSFRNKTVLDVGCGTGRNSFWILEAGAKKVVGVDYDKRTVDVAKNNLKHFNNKEIKFQSVYDMKYKNDFDIVLSIGVVHHLKDPKTAVRNMIRAARKNGKILIWVYGFEGNEWIIKYVSPLRKGITSRMPLRVLHLFTYFLATPLYLYVKLMPQKNEYLKQISGFRLRHVMGIVFDQLIPTIANYWKKEEVLELFSGVGVKDVKIYKVNNNSWTAIATKVG